jgi:hypothetical protein
MVLAFLGGAPCFVQFRDKGDEDSRADESERRRGPQTQPEDWACDREFSQLRGIKMRESQKSAASLLGAAAVAGLMSASTAQAAPAGQVTLSDGNLINVIQRGVDQYDLHAYPAGPGWLGKGAGCCAPPAAHRHHR